MANLIEYRSAAIAKFDAIVDHDVAILLERGCYNETIKKNIECDQSLILGSLEFMSRYDSIVLRVLLNLSPKSTIGSEELMRAIESGAIQPKDAGSMSSAELTPKANEDIRANLELRGRQKVIQKISTAYKCRKCGESKTTYEEYQGRSGDEASNMSFKCLCCGHVWHT